MSLDLVFGNTQQSTTVVETAVYIFEGGQQQQQQQVDVRKRSKPGRSKRLGLIQQQSGRCPDVVALSTYTGRVPSRPASMASWHPSMIRGVHVRHDRYEAGNLTHEPPSTCLPRSSVTEPPWTAGDPKRPVGVVVIGSMGRGVVMRSLLRFRQGGGGTGVRRTTHTLPAVPRPDAIITTWQRGGDGGKMFIRIALSRVPLGSIMLLPFGLRLAER
ncbi:hypothetical protein B0T18DRAFT_396530 [Schizothecium vesticola]|uniref:Uncharacterized protein n=1 Tax=Schizothecium vesticola TaxID=314040 RepID=A0AA40KBX9_9PEZI|nr:hypothetical protein B0T18DRAFT_396530 [Schizothecium vesticola]